MLWIFVLIDVFITLQKKLKFHARVQKCHFGKLKNFQNGTFEPMHEIQIFFAQMHFLKVI